MLMVECFMKTYTFFLLMLRSGRPFFSYRLSDALFKTMSSVWVYLFDLSLQLLVEVPEIPHGQLILCAHHDPLHVDLIW